MWDKFEVRSELALLLEENFLQDDKVDGISRRTLLRLPTWPSFQGGLCKLRADKNYKLIVETAECLSESIIQKDKLLIYYD